MKKNIYFVSLLCLALSFVSCGSGEQQAENAETAAQASEETVVVTEEFTVNDVKFTMVAVEGGNYFMGCTEEQLDENDDDDELPAHTVTLDNFMIGQTEVTQQLYEAVMGVNPSAHVSPLCPVENVSHFDALAFIEKLNALTGLTFRLPTEAEWEYAARGGKYDKGTIYSGSNNVQEVAWMWTDSGTTPLNATDEDFTLEAIVEAECQTHDVATKVANEIGIYDMSGNVWEWVSDHFDNYSADPQVNPQGPEEGETHVFRGGSYCSPATYCRCANRAHNAPEVSGDYLGFRLVLVK